MQNSPIIVYIFSAYNEIPNCNHYIHIIQTNWIIPIISEATWV